MWRTGRTLRAGASAATLRLGCRLVSLSQSAGAVDLTFADGTRATAKVVIGADGVHTTVGPFVTSTGPPRFSGICAYRCLVPADRAPAFARRPVQTLWLGPGRHLVHYPICGGELVNVVAITPAGDWTTESWSAKAASRTCARSPLAGRRS